MNFIKKPWFWIIVVVVLAALWFMGSYNRFVTLDESVDGQWAQVEVQLQRRFDLIPNLVGAVQGIFDQEREVFEAIAEARTRYSGAGSVDEKVQAATGLESALGRLLVIMENYPELRSQQNVTQLMDQLEGTENRVSVERRRFNEIARDYNIAIKRFPGMIAASLFGFDDRALFEAVEGADVAPTVDFNN